MGYGHVIPQIIQRAVCETPPLTVYGSEPTRSFCYVSDAVRATELVMESKEADGKIIHIGNDQEEISIRETVDMILTTAKVCTDIETMPPPDGCVMRRLPNIRRLRQLGFAPEVGLRDGLAITINWYLDELRS